MIAPQPPVGLDDDDIGEQHHAAGQHARQRGPVQAARRQAEMATAQAHVTQRVDELRQKVTTLPYLGATRTRPKHTLRARRSTTGKPRLRNYRKASPRHATARAPP